MTTTGGPGSTDPPEPVWSEALVKRFLLSGLRSPHEELVDDLDQFLQPAPAELCRKFETLLGRFVERPERLLRGELTLPELEEILDRMRVRGEESELRTDLAQRRAALATHWTVLAAALHHHGRLLDRSRVEATIDPAEAFHDLGDTLPSPWSELFHGAAEEIRRRDEGR